MIERFSRADMIRCVLVLLDSSRGSTSARDDISKRKRERNHGHGIIIRECGAIRTRDVGLAYTTTVSKPFRARL